MGNKCLRLSWTIVFALSLILGTKAAFAFVDRDSTHPLKVFDRAWTTAKSNIYPNTLADRFTAEKYRELRGSLSESSSLQDVALALNPFLTSLSISHTSFLTDQDLDFWFLKSLFDAKDVDQPHFFHLGCQMKNLGSGWWVRAVPEGSPGAKAGLKRGDIVTQFEGRTFHPIKSFAQWSKKKSGRLVWRRNQFMMSALVTPMSQNIHRTLVTASIQSQKVIQLEGRRIGYFHLWSGTHTEFLSALKSAVQHFAHQTDGMILDLRDGYGGAWWDYLDPFFPSRKNMFQATRVSRNGQKEDLSPGERLPGIFYEKPLVILINEGVRSGKESLAFEFQKSKRATLVGTRTAGAFVAGRAYFSDEQVPYILFLSVQGMELDGKVLEGRGVPADIEVPYTQFEAEDPQLKVALNELLKRTESASKIRGLGPSKKVLPARTIRR